MLRFDDRINAAVVRSAAFSPDGWRIVTASGDKTARALPFRPVQGVDQDQEPGEPSRAADTGWDVVSARGAHHARCQRCQFATPLAAA